MQSSAQSPIRLRPELSKLPQLVAYIALFAHEHGLNISDTYALTLAAEELFSNTIRHSRSPANWVLFSLIHRHESVIATYTDDAPPFDPTLQAESDITASAGTRPVGGLGIHFIRRAMRSFDYRRLDNRNVVTFTRHLTG